MMHEQTGPQLGPQPGPRPARQRGFSLFSAIFLLVMLSALGAAIVKVSTSSQIASAIEVQGERAYQAARAGIEWGLYRQLRSNSCAATTSFALPAGNTLSNFTVTVKCVITRTPVDGVVPPADQLARASPLNADGLTLKPIAGTLTRGSTEVTGVPDTRILADGMMVRGSGIAAGTRILNVTASSTLTLTKMPIFPATGPATSSPNDITYMSDLDRHTLTSTSCNQPVGGACVAATSNNPDYVQRVLEVRF